MRSKFKWIFTLTVAFMMQFSFAQEKTVTGVVSDALGPLAGANVVVKGTNKGTTTDFNGGYSIKANVGDVLVFSYVGTEDTSIVVTTLNAYNVTLKVVELKEVVVTALGIKREEKALGYSMTSLKGDEVAQSRESNVLNALSGKVAGLQITSSSGSVGSSSRVVLRGAKSITGNNSPLYVIDGTPVDDRNYGNATSGGGNDVPNALASINPDDIESISVLKGASASALYGNRGSNGVIIVTTKSGGKGKSSVIGVSFSSTMTFSNPLVLPDYQNSYGQGNNPNYFNFVDGASGGSDDGVDESWGPALDKGLNFVQWDNFKYGGAASPWVSHPNNVKDFFNTGVSRVNNISFSGSGDKSAFRLSIGNSDEEGMVPFTDFKKFTVTANGQIDLSDNLKAGIAVNYFNDKSNNLPNVGYSNENPMQQFIWSARNVNFSDLRDWRNLPLAPAGTAAEGTPLNWNNNYQNNPYWVLETNRNTFDRDRLLGNFNLNYSLSDSFSISGKLALDQFSLRQTQRKSIGTNSNPDGFYQEVNRKFNEVNAELFLNFKKKITEDFDFSLSAGGNKRTTISSVLFGTANALELPNLYDLNNIKTGTTPVFGDAITKEQINSLIGFGQISYKNYAFLDFTGRNDWSSVLPIANNSVFYPSVNTSLVLSDMFNIKGKLDFLKVRGGWAQVGTNGALVPYSTNLTYVLANNGWGNQASNSDTLFSSTLVPEITTSTEVGVDMEWFGRRLRFSGTYYNSKSEDLLIPSDVSDGFGANASWINGPSLQNKGFELQLGGTVVKAKDFSFDVDVNFTKNENIVTSLGDQDTYVLGGQWGVTIEARLGEPYGSIVGRDFERDANGSVIYSNGVPVINPTKEILGNVTPDWTGGVNFSMKYKTLDFSTLIDAKMGGDLHSMSYAWGRYAGTLEETLVGRETGVVGDGVMSDGNGGYVPNNVVVDAQAFNKASFGNTVESSAIFDASFVKLRQISIGYSLPKKFLNGTPIADFRVSLNARNVAILYKKVPHIDPETGFDNTNGEQGQEFGQLPSARSYGFNINVKF